MKGDNEKINPNDYHFKGLISVKVHCVSFCYKLFYKEEIKIWFRHSSCLVIKIYTKSIN